jgi:uncharacterized membrane protein YeaQ/YmgE (transglycosylase-associated protein family)
MLELNRRWFMQFIWTLVIGFLAGVIAKLLMPGRDPGGLIITTALGMAGALLLASIVGAVIILAVYRLILRRAAPH